MEGSLFSGSHRNHFRNLAGESFGRFEHDFKGERLCAAIF